MQYKHKRFVYLSEMHHASNIFHLTRNMHTNSRKLQILNTNEKLNIEEKLKAKIVDIIIIIFEEMLKTQSFKL